MGKNRIIVTIVLIVMLIAGWGMFTYRSLSQANKVKTQLATADEYVKKGLYDRAIGIYTEMIEESEDNKNIKNTDVIWKNIISAHEKKCAELYREDDLEVAETEYIAALSEAVKALKTNHEYAIELANIYMHKGNYEGAYSCLAFVKANGVKEKELDELLKKAQYKCEQLVIGYEDIQTLSYGAYSVKTVDGWKVATLSEYEDEVFTGKYEYINQRSEDGTYLITKEKDTKLYNAAGKVLGVFGQKIYEAGMFSEGLIAVKEGDKYYYYDSFAKKVSDGYDFAGAFKDGKAAVCKDGKWRIMDSSGAVGDKEYDDIVLSGQGYYERDGVIIAAIEGVYELYDSKWKKINSKFTCDEVDGTYFENLIAFREGDKWGYIDLQGNVVIKPQYEGAKSFSKGLGAVCKDGRWGFINEKNEIVIEPQYHGADYFDEDGKCMVQVHDPYISAEPTWTVLKLLVGIK